MLGPLLPVDHVKQRFSWDCGISAVAMTLSTTERLYLLENLDEISKEEGFYTSTWTIDLSFLLKRFRVPHRYFTTTLGVNPDHAKEAYYRRDDHLRMDAERVAVKFSEAVKTGDPVVRVETLTSSELASCVSDHRKPVILLVCASRLYCSLCNNNRVLSKLVRVFHLPLGYQGHYIVLVGYDAKQRSFYYRNPSLTDRVCRIPEEDLDFARLQSGTDQDLIIIDR